MATPCSLRWPPQTTVALVEEWGKTCWSTVQRSASAGGPGHGHHKPATEPAVATSRDRLSQDDLRGEGRTACFPTQSIELDGQPTAAGHRFSQTGTVAYEAIGIPKTTAISTPPSPASTTTRPPPTSPSSTRWAEEPLPIQGRRREGGQWRFCDNGMAATAANPRHPNYGKHSTPFTEHLDDPFAGDAWAFSEAAVHRGTFLVLDAQAPWPRNRTDHGPDQGHGAPHRAAVSSKTASMPLTSRTTRVPPTSFHRQTTVAARPWWCRGHRSTALLPRAGARHC